MTLVLGPNGAGKTHLLRRLQNYQSNKGSTTEDWSGTIPTVGTNMVDLSFGARKTVGLREIGGSMAPIWHNYYENTSQFMYVMDGSCPQQMAAACILLLDILSHPHMKANRVLIVLNKADLPSAMTVQEVTNQMRLKAIQQHTAATIQVASVSSCLGFGVPDVMKWLSDTRT